MIFCYKPMVVDLEIYIPIFTGPIHRRTQGSHIG